MTVQFPTPISAASSLTCYSCDTLDDDVSRCPTTTCSGEDAVCYKIERNFKEVTV